MRVPADIQISDLSADLPAGRSNFGSYSELLPLGHNHPPSTIPWILARAYPSAPPQAAEMGSYLLTRGHPDPFRSVHDLGLDQSMTSGMFRSVVQASPENREVVHPCASQR